MFKPSVLTAPAYEPRALGISPALTNTSATPLRNVCPPPPSHALDSWLLTDGKTNVDMVSAVAASSIPASLAICGSISEVNPPEFHIALEAAVTPKKVDKTSAFSLANCAVVEVTSHTRIPSATFSAPVKSTLPCSKARRSDPPQPQNTSTLP